ncbi:EamA family transporter [Ectobacillus sp. sgz5001026]|uniref:EamA family transporter n=1 Tax=Ectobacillus sp. sgz5001026 TaxID=3242473 RepID=UPI0036D278A4
MKVEFKHYVYLHLTFFLYSLIMLYMKWSSTVSLGSIYFFLAYFVLLFFLFLYAVIWQQVIAQFEISKAYSHRGVIIIWTIVWSALFFHEHIVWNQIIGAAVIIFGIVVVTKDE